MIEVTYEEVFSIEHLLDAGKKCCRNVRWKSSTQMFELTLLTWVATLRKGLLDGTYKAKQYAEFDIMERGKLRHIKALHIADRCVQKCLVEYFLKPLLVPKLIYDNSANIKGKGTEFAIKRLKQHLAHHYKKHGRKGGILIIDYHDYFASIDHDILLKRLKQDIKDPRLYEVTKNHIDSYSGNKGLGLGSETSQILAVYYPNPIDHYIKEHLHIEGYGRYMDDCYLIHENIEYLEFCKKMVEIQSRELGLTLNAKTKIYKLDGGFKYLKKRFFITETGKIVTRLERRNVKRRRQTIKKMFLKNVPVEECANSYECWRGYAKHYNSYHTVVEMDKLFLNCSQNTGG